MHINACVSVYLRSLCLTDGAFLRYLFVCVLSWSQEHTQRVQKKLGRRMTVAEKLASVFERRKMLELSFQMKILHRMSVLEERVDSARHRAETPRTPGVRAD